MNNNNNWEEWKPQGPAGKFDKYKTQIVVIVGVAKNTSKTSKGRIYLTDAVLKFLGNPTHIAIKTRGPNIALTSSNTSVGAYAIAKRQDSIKNATPFISCGAFIEQYKHESFHLVQGIYSAHIDSGMVIFDMQQTPSKF